MRRIVERSDELVVARICPTKQVHLGGDRVRRQGRFARRLKWIEHNAPARNASNGSVANFCYPVITGIHPAHVEPHFSAACSSP